MNEPLISIYMPTHNRLEYLKKSVNSIISQTYDNWELIIVNDASNDGTELYLDEISSSDPRISFITNATSRGACYSRNLAIRNSNGKYITGLDDDDLFTMDRLQVFIDNYNDSYSFLSSDWIGFPSSYWKNLKQKLIYRHGEISLKTLLDKNHIGNQIFIEKYKIVDIGGFDESLSAWQDYDLWVRLVKEYGSALKLKNKMQFICFDNELNRITNSSKRIDGIKSFKNKHQDVLNERQYKRIEKIIKKLIS